jgi:hypothetical protein
MPWTRADDNPLYHTAAWRRARTKTLREARGRCEAHLEGCQGAASQVDHVDGIDADPGHTRLRAVCTSCHRKITAQQGGGARNGRTSDPAPQPRTTW